MLGLHITERLVFDGSPHKYLYIINDNALGKTVNIGASYHRTTCF